MAVLVFLFRIGCFIFFNPGWFSGPDFTGFAVVSKQLQPIYSVIFYVVTMEKLSTSGVRGKKFENKLQSVAIFKKNPIFVLPTPVLTPVNIRKAVAIAI